MKTALLVGCGAEIGSTLVGMVDPVRDGFRISAILTHPIPPDPKHPHLHPLDSLYARVVLAQPSLLDAVQLIYDKNQLLIRGQAIQVYWGDSVQFDLSQFKESFDICVLATSKKQIGDSQIIGRFAQIAGLVIGVSEAKLLPAVYPNLTGLPDTVLSNPPRPIQSQRLFCVGSCQSNGWHAPLRGLLELVEHTQLNTFHIAAIEVDIVHPDTPTGRLGTQSIEARHQDPRNNFRPSFSQIEMSMNLLFPQSHNLSTVSLRTLTMPPGYQICHFFFQYSRKSKQRLTREEVVTSFRQTADSRPTTLRMSDLPLGSRAFEQCESAAVALSGEPFFRFYDNPFHLPMDSAVSELITQTYVHNVRGYCRSVIEAIRYLLFDPSPKAFFK